MVPNPSSVTQRLMRRRHIVLSAICAALPVVLQAEVELSAGPRSVCTNAFCKLPGVVGRSSGFQHGLGRSKKTPVGRKNGRAAQTGMGNRCAALQDGSPEGFVPLPPFTALIPVHPTSPGWSTTHAVPCHQHRRHAVISLCFQASQPRAGSLEP